MTLGQVIRHYRKERKLTQTRLAQALGVSQGLISFWESGRDEPSIEMLRQLASTLEIPTSALVEGIAKKQPEQLVAAE